MTTITFQKIGDFYEHMALDRENLRAVADLLNKTITPTRHGAWTVGVPYWQIDEAIRVLADAGYTVELT